MKYERRACGLSVLFATALVAAPLFAQAPPPPVVSSPTPTPSATPRPSSQPVAPQTPAGPLDGASVNPRLAGVPIYAGAAFLYSFDLDRGQTVFTFGTNDPYVAVIGFYKSKYRAQEVTKTPPIQQFDLGNFDAGTMSQRPSVTVKDFSWPDGTGYLHVVGSKQTKYLTIIQIIPTR